MPTDSNSPLRVAILTNIIPGYRTPIFVKLNRDDRFRIRFFVSMPIANSDPVATLTLDIRQTRSLNIFVGTRTRSAEVVQRERLPIPIGLPFDLIRYRPSVIICGDLGVRSLTAWLVSQLIGAHLVIWTEETIEHDSSVRGIQKRLRKFLIPRAHAFLAWGQSACNFLRHQGVTESKINYCAQAVDNDEWSRRAAQSYPDKVRVDLDVRGKMCFTVGRLLPRKGFREFLTAYGALPERIRNSHTLVMTGDGTEREMLSELADRLDIRHFRMTGAKTPDELADLYRAADFMVLPSLTEVWGLVANEAMACGTPVLSSTYAGVTEELIINTGIGEAFDPTDQDAFTSMLSRWLESPPSYDPEMIQRTVFRLNFDGTVNTFTRLLLDISAERAQLT